MITGDGGFEPKALPRDHDAPITIHGGGRISTISGAFPPIIKTITIDYDKHGSLQTAGLPVCTTRKLQNTTVAQARRACPGAIVGKGLGRGVVVFPDQKPIPASSPITVFNGPKVHGQDTVIGRKWTYKGVHHSFINARCPDGHLQARGAFAFDDGTMLSGTFVKTCQIRRG